MPLSLFTPGINFPKTPPSLITLPKEIHTLIFSHLPLPTALVLSYTCKTLHSASHSRIWSSLDLSLTPHFGEYPLTQTYHHGTDAHCRWAKGEATRAEDRGRDEARRRVEEIIRLGCKAGSLGLVRKIKIEQRKGVNNSIVQLLSFVRDGVREIEIVPPPDHVFEEEWKPAFPHTLFAKLHDFGPKGFQFSALKQLNITLAEYDFSNSLSLITNRAPLLHELFISIPFRSTLHRLTKNHVLYDTFKFPTFTELPNLKVLFIQTSYDTHDLPLAFLDILRKAPLMERLVLSNAFEAGDWDGDEVEDVEANFYETLRSMKHLIDLQWLWNTGRTFSEVLAKTGFEQLNALTMMHAIDSLAGERLEFVHIPRLPELETLEIGVRHHYTPLKPSANVKSALFPDHPRDIHRISPDIVNSLRLAPSLELISFSEMGKMDHDQKDPDKWVEKQLRGCLIRSFKHGDDELFHVRHHTYSVPLKSGDTDSDNEDEDGDSDDDYEDDDTRAHHTYTDPTGKTSITTYITSDELYWQDATDYKGHIVPLEIIRKMRKAECAEEEDWVGRGIEMGEIAWEVLERWYERITKVEEVDKDEDGNGIGVGDGVGVGLNGAGEGATLEAALKGGGEDGDDDMGAAIDGLDDGHDTIEIVEDED